MAVDIDLEIIFYNLIFAVSYILIVNILFERFILSTKQIIGTVLVFNIIFVLILSQLFLLKNGHYFSFSAVDSLYYEDIAKDAVKLNYKAGVNFFLENINSLDDVGYPLFLLTVYSVWNFTLFARIAIIIFTVLGAYYHFKTALFILPRNYAMLSTLIVFISPFTVHYASNGLKELIMLFISTVSVYHATSFILHHKIKNLLYGLSLALLMAFFRIPLILLLYASFITGIFFSEKRAKHQIFLYFAGLVVFAIGYFTYINFQEGIERFTSLDPEHQLERFSNTAGQGTRFTQIVMFIAAFIGPFPNLLPFEGKENLSVISYFLYIRLLLSPFFLFGIYNAIAKKTKAIYIMLAFTAFEIGSLYSIREIFEFRKAIPHFGFIITLSIYGFTKSKILKKYYFYYFIILISMVIYWNFGRL